MFETFYKFQQVGVDRAHNKKYLKEVITYSFRSSHYYLVEVEVYVNDIYIIKYYLKKHKNNPLKYSLLTNEYRGAKVISTCIRIMLSIYDSNKNASFGFIGSHTINQRSNFIEPTNSTKRFRVYRTSVLRLFGLQTFTHYQDIEHSAYLMINNNHNVELVKEYAKKMFSEIYPDLKY